MAKWHWIVRNRANWDREYEQWKKGYIDEPCPHIYAEGYIEGTRQEAIGRAKFDRSSQRQVIEVKRVK